MIKQLKSVITVLSLSSWVIDMVIISLFMMWKRSGHSYDISLNLVLFIVSVGLNLLAGYFCVRLMKVNRSSGLKASMAAAYVFTFKTATLAILVVARFS